MVDWLILYKQGLKNLLHKMRDEIGSVYGGVKSQFLTRDSSLKSVDSLEPCECLLILMSLITTLVAQTRVNSRQMINKL